MLSIAHECEANDTIIADRHFAGIIDFSQAERHGFIQAFVAFWMQRHENTRSEDTLYSAAEVLLRGCEEHFRASVTRIKKIHGVVPVHSEKHFEELVLGLISAKDLDDFHARVEVIQRDFPLTNSWLGWWLRESNARMLFETHTRMEPDIWTSIPNTTNAQEAQHWKLYSAVGRDHGLLEGLEALHAVAETTVKLFTANLEGGLIRYGKAEPWKAMINLIGRSKPSRAPSGRSTKQKSDGRPPDTKKDLLSRTPKKSKELPSTHHTNSAIVGPASYRWDNMSCWADSAWDLLYRSIVKDWASFSSRFSSDSQTEHPIRDFYNLMLLRRNAEHDSFILKVPDYDLSTALSSQRDQFRRRLVEWRIIKSDNAVGNAFDWFPQVLKDKLNDDLDDDNWTQSYFQTMFVTIKHCSGDGNGHHYQVCQKPEIRYLIVLRQAACQEFKGDLLSWLQTFANVNHSPQALPTCWRARDGESWCKGSQTDVKFILSLPVVLILEEEECTTSTEFWNFPALLQPYKSGELATVTYDIVGRIFYSRSKNHYISRFLDEDGKTVWTYDDMAHGGCPYVEPGATAGTHLTGSSSTLKLPSDFIGAFAIYHLRNGTSTQEAIYTSQLAVARRVHHMMVEPDSLRHHVPKIWLSRVKFAQLTPHDLTWLKNPFRLDTLDYQETTESSVSPQEQDQMHSVETLDHGLNHCSRPGKGALVQHGKFYYPVRIIHTSGAKGKSRNEFECVVKFWRGCHFPKDSTHPLAIVSVDQSSIIDELWGNQHQRRQTRLGRWDHPPLRLSEEDILMQFEDYPYTEEVNDALKPHLEFLKTLHCSPQDCSVEEVPAKVYVEKSKKPIHQCTIPFTGGLTIEDQARVANWFEKFVSQTPSISRSKWHSLLAHAHAITLFLDHRLHRTATGMSESERLHNAWNHQTTTRQISSNSSNTIDVDLECLEYLETRMFERSREAGVAGWYQWGLDVGYHQDNWDPYIGLREGLNHFNFQDEKGDSLEVSISSRDH
ncbi:uncharacterized protein C8R40DRAFT_1250870 [Lentinula edodes]|uniref:uncharacterized protein n=1 Tax=Lentinula edodes TaxID=5353 RepID=UPI001E8E7E4B|nr:uncharacterized protein C8R40DRAFT_1250870 [Lentinula edodes]KAH7875730.1 hypothetical protein C8R40DRAFT_1250870 [Lentinula edodes]